MGTTKTPTKTTAKRASKTSSPTKTATPSSPTKTPAVMPATWRALRTALPRKARAAVVRAFAGGTPTTEDVLALELGVLAVLMEDATKNARYLAPHLRHIAALSEEIRDQKRRAERSRAWGG